MEANIAASVAKMKVPRGSKGPSVKSKLSKVSNATKSHKEMKRQNAEADSFVPQSRFIETHGQTLPSYNVTDPHIK